MIGINKYIYSQIIDFSNLENILKLSCSKNFHTIDSSNFEDLISILSKECKNLKNAYKNTILERTSIRDALTNIIYDSAEYYSDNIPNSNDIKSKTKFINLISKIMIDISVNLNKGQER